MKDTASDITEAELSVMWLLWDHPDSTIRGLTDVLYPGGSTSHYATVQKLLERLEKKGFAKRDSTETPHKFRPRVGRDDLVGRRLKAVADKLCGGSLTPLLTHLIQSRPLTPEEVASLRQLIDQNGKPARKRRRE